jgi:hypothetical protein
MNWYDAKLIAIEVSGLGRDALHIYVGIGGQILMAVLLRRTLASPLPWLCVLAAELANEWFDLNHEDWPDRPMWPGSLHDVWVTMLVPTILFLMCRYAPALFHSKAPDPQPEPIPKPD